MLMNLVIQIEEIMDMVLPVINGTKLDIDYNLVQIGNKSLSDYITEHIIREQNLLPMDLNFNILIFKLKLK